MSQDNAKFDFRILTITFVLNILSYIFDIITYPFYVLIQKPWRRVTHRVRAQAVSKSDNEITYHSVDQPGKIYIRMLETHTDTLELMFKRVAKIHTTKKCLGTREILAEEDEIQPNGKVFKKYKLGDYKWMNFTETEEKARFFGRGMRELGLQPKDKVVIFAETRAEWMIAAHGLFKQSCTIVTIYATLGDEAIMHGVNETEVKTIITSHELLPKIRKILNSIPNINTIIYFEDQLKKTDASGFGDVRVVPFSRVVENGSASKFEEFPPRTDDIAFIMYTSGSTGTPKGVLLTHSNCIATMECYCDLEILSGDVGIGFLPLAHVFELLAESVALLRGVPIGYSTPNTLLDTSSKVMKESKGDMTILQPTAMTIVPLILDRIIKTIDDKLNKGSAVEKAIFHLAYDYKRKWLARGFCTPMLDALIFKKIAKILGGRMRVLVTGGAPLSPETQERIRVILCVSVVQGYGLTETTAGATLSSVRDSSVGRVGAPSPLVDIRLVNWEEGHYRVTNKPYPQGEVLVGGFTISPGYYKLPDKTAEEFFEEDEKRWFRTGDIGEMHPDGVLKIIDRKKDLVKLQQGEYISLGKVETELKTSLLVDNICVYGDSLKEYCVALIVPNAKALKELAATLNISGSFEELCSNIEVEKAALKEITEQGKRCHLDKFEIPAKITLCKEVWSPTMGLITAAFKIKRKDIQKTYQADIDRMYGK
ncbi:CLUMA_CG000812, isoform A [Clunio marinus]|uniref:long-chain-fatty-acid--CoA ligase n=1 Tax=Clunio marinus TaxID=568069 RepID=A0A1J1HG82_9DIPT|nr:CLUMA_CG000812, isoform A [Clunio marinus]